MENKYLKHPFPAKAILICQALTTIAVPVVLYVFGMGALIALIVLLVMLIMDFVFVNILGFYPVVDSDCLRIGNYLSKMVKEYDYADISSVEIREEISDKRGNSLKMDISLQGGKKVSRTVVISREMVEILCNDLREKGVPEVKNGVSVV